MKETQYIKEFLKKIELADSDAFSRFKRNIPFAFGEKGQLSLSNDV